MSETSTPKRVFENFERSYTGFLDATELTKREKAQRLASQMDQLLKTRGGLKYLYEKVEELEANGFFAKTPWEDPGRLVPSLVRGTLHVGHPDSTYELMSEIRILRRYHDGKRDGFDSEQAREYIEEVVGLNLEFAFNEISEVSRAEMASSELRKATNVFGWLLEHVDLSNLKNQLAEEIKLTCEQRPIVTRKVRQLIRMVEKRFDLDSDQPIDRELRLYVDAIYNPSPLSAKTESSEEYWELLDKASSKETFNEAHSMGYFMRETGLVSRFHSILLLYLVENRPDLVPEGLALEPKGKAEWHEHQRFVKRIIQETVTEGTSQCIYGLSHLLERALLSRRAVRSSFNNLRRAMIHPHVEKRILKSVSTPMEGVAAKQYLLGATIRILGQPLGIGQGNNATCQSARGISMWSQHSPGKLIDMIITVCTRNNLIMRFENDVLESIKLEKGLVEKLDYNLDAVSAILVPHLDKIYNEMMRRATGRGEDPHKWVNPALYGHWIEVGFAGVYNYLTNSIHDFRGFVKLLYAGFHPDYNGGRKMIYPNPVGIFITSSKGEMVGFHAVSLLRVKKNKETGEVRAYFLNPNNEGRQDWGQGIKPMVAGNGEQHGESSLPLHQFAARVYAFHYNPLEVTHHLHLVPEEDVDMAEELARSSWGKNYIWNEFSKKW